MPARMTVKGNSGVGFYTRKCAGRLVGALLLNLLLLGAASVEAGTIVRVSTTVGDFSIELYDAVTWRTVANFLGYVNGEALDINGDPLGGTVNFNQTYLHRTQSAETQGIGIVQGGAYRFQSFTGPIPITTSGLIPNVLNEPQYSNTRGTIAMAKIAGNPDSASYQWFFNTSDNSNPLDIDNGGFTVFGQVLGGADGSDTEAGMQVLDTIQGLQKYRPCVVSVACPRADFAPIVTEEYGGKPDEEFVFVSMAVVSRYSQAVNLFEPLSQQIMGAVAVDDVAAYRIRFQVLVVDNQIILDPIVDSLLLLRDIPAEAATFSSGSNRLIFPSIELSESDTLCNVEFELSDPQAPQFRLLGTPDSC
ncbi:MAG: peptidylprolyl isomerase [Gammaproteobacteria bacterium]|nr:peptidylprolyl isomerase [Pseudomonadales bacterium]MCP5345642.1 peptidylprolyl isomerase [Pseudomonadales bacterium]